MFFILNNEKSVLAADQAFLERANVQSIYLLAEHIRSGDFQLNEEENTCQLGEAIHSFIRNPVQTIFGVGYLYQVSEEPHTSKSFQRVKL